MKRRRIGCLIAVALALLMMGTLIWWFLFSEFMVIDRCLDAGGRWGGPCEFESRPE